MILCFQQEKKGESMKDKIIEYGTEILYKGIQEMNKKEKLLLLHLAVLYITITISLVCNWHQLQTIKAYKQADYRLGLRLDEVHDQLEIIKILAQGETQKSTKEELAELLEEYFKTKRSK